MAVRPRPVGSDPIERVFHPIDLLQIGPIYIGSVQVPIIKYPLDIGSHWVQNQFTISSPPLRLKATSSTGTPATTVILLFSWSRRSLVFTGASIPNTRYSLFAISIVQNFRSFVFMVAFMNLRSLGFCP